MTGRPASQPHLPESPPITGPERHRLRSADWTQRADLEFVNDRPELLFLYWLNYKGRRVQYDDLEPGERVVMSTYLTHPWVVCDSADRQLGHYLPLPGSSRVVIR